MRAGNAAPEVLAHRTRHRRQPRVGPDGNTEAEAVPRRQQRRSGGDRAEMVGRHQFDRLAAGKPAAGVAPAGHQHLQEAQVGMFLKHPICITNLIFYHRYTYNLKLIFGNVMKYLNKFLYTFLCTLFSPYNKKGKKTSESQTERLFRTDSGMG